LKKKNVNLKIIISILNFFFKYKNFTWSENLYFNSENCYYNHLKNYINLKFFISLFFKNIIWIWIFYLNMKIDNISSYNKRNSKKNHNDKIASLS